MYKRLFVILSLCLLPITGFADKPPIPKPLADRVNLATHVFIGKATRVRAVRYVKGKIEKITPEPTHTGAASGVMIELEMRVEEVLFPASWQPPEMITVYFSGGIFPIKELRHYFLADRYVYLTSEAVLHREKVFFPSYPWQLTEGLDKKQEIRTVLDQRGSN